MAKFVGFNNEKVMGVAALEIVDINSVLDEKNL